MAGSRVLAGLAKCLFLFCSLEQSAGHAGLVQRECRSDSLRLPRRVRPVHYELDLKVATEELLFGGSVEIDLEFDRLALARDVTCQQAGGKESRGGPKNGDSPLHCNTKAIILHADADLLISEASFVEQSSGGAIAVREICRDRSSSHLVVMLDREPEPGSAGKLTLVFQGYVNTLENKGLYLGNNPDEEKPMLVTQFESAYARMVFPLFDEPDLKATFGLTVWHAKGYKALSNTPALDERLIFDQVEKRDYVQVQFEVTPPMSSYLLALAIGDFDHIEETLPDSNMTVGMWTPVGRAGDARESLAIAVASYQLLLDYFKIEQPIRKMDFVAVEKFDGGMENWGLITFETTLLLDGQRERAIARDKIFAVETVAHEVAHNWFGNLVTMKWWDDLWLNEGFASWISNRICEQMLPGYGFHMNYLTNTMTVALAIDAIEDQTHPVKNPKLQTVQQIENSFDSITYRKADCIIRMLHDYIGHEQFQRALRRYIARHQFGNTEADDLWAVLEEISGLDVSSLVDTWIHQAGHPLVEATMYQEKSDERESLRLRQRKFAAAAAKKKKRPNHGAVTWKIPITVRVTDGANRTTDIQLVLDDSEDVVKLPLWFDLDKPGHWLKVNQGFKGFYRVQYRDQRLRGALRRAFQTRALEPADRLNLVDDTRALFFAGLINTTQLADVYDWLRDEDDDAVMIEIVKFFQWTITDSTDNLVELLTKNYPILRNYYSKTGGVAAADDSNEIRAKARSAVARLLLSFEDTEVIRESLEEYKINNASVVPYLQSTVYPAVARAGSDEQFYDVLDRIARVASASAQTELAGFVKEILAGSDRLKVATDYFP